MRGRVVSGFPGGPSGGKWFGGGGSEHLPRLTRGRGTAAIPPIPRTQKVGQVRWRIDRPPLDGEAGDLTAGGDRDMPAGLCRGGPPIDLTFILIKGARGGVNYSLLGFVGLFARAFLIKI